MHALIDRAAIRHRFIFIPAGEKSVSLLSSDRRFARWCAAKTVDGVFVLGTSEAELAERCTFTTRTAVRGSKLVDQNDRNLLCVYLDRISGGEKCLMSIAMGSVICSF